VSTWIGFVPKGIIEYLTSVRRELDEWLPEVHVVKPTELITCESVLVVSHVQDNMRSNILIHAINPHFFNITVPGLYMQKLIHEMDIKSFHCL
jgi:hypothetical protein